MYIKIISIFLIMALVYMLYQYRNAKIKERSLKSIKNSNGNGKNYLFLFYKFFKKTPILKKQFEKIVTRLMLLYPTDIMEINKRATNIMLFSVVLAFITSALVILTSGGSFFYICGGLIITYIFFINTIAASLDKLETELLLQFQSFLSDITFYFQAEKNMIDTAVYQTLDQTAYEMGLHAHKIYKILTATNTKEEADKYIEISPNRFITTFVAICSSTKIFGDKVLEGKQSLFLKNCNYLKEEVNIEILKLRRNQFLFSSLVFLCCLPIFFIKPIEMYNKTYIPDMKIYYEGAYGVITIAVIFAIVLLCYTLVSNLKDTHGVIKKESILFKKLASISIISRLLTKQINKQYTKSLRIGDMLKLVGDDSGIKAYYLKRYIFAIVAFILINSTMIGAIVQQKIAVVTNFATSYETVFTPNSETKKLMIEVSKDLMSENNNYSNSDYDELKNISIKYGNGKINDNQAKKIAEEVINKSRQLKETNFKLWYIVLSIIGAIIAYNIPLVILKFKLSNVEMEMENEINSYQTIALMLMHVDGMTTRLLLEWIERFAYCFKNSIVECIISLPYGEAKAINKMKRSEPFSLFKRFCNNLSNITETGMVIAFSDIETERNYLKEKRRDDNEKLILKKAAKAKWIAVIPALSTIALYLIIPMLLMGNAMLAQLSSVF